MDETANPRKARVASPERHEQEKENTEVISQLESPQEIAESTKDMIPKEFIQGNMNVEEEPQAEDQEENLTKGTAGMDQHPIEQTGSDKGTIVPLKRGGN